MYNAEVNGINLYYDRMGSGEPLVLIHGLGERKESWRYQHNLAEHFELIIPDLRGFGKTSCPDGEEITINAFAKDLIALLDHLGIKQAHICGLSMGGIVCQEIYRIDPERVKSFVLANSLYYVPKWFAKLLLKFRKKQYENLTIDQYKSAATLTCLYDKSEAMVKKAMVMWSDHLDGLLPAWKSSLQIDYRKMLKTMNVPTLVIACKNDKVCPTYNQKKMHKLISNSKIYMIKEAGHVGKIEKHEEFNRVLLGFLVGGR